MGKSRGRYHEEFPVGTEVQIADGRRLDRFARTWKHRHPLEALQVSYAGVRAIVKTVAFYHGGDELYTLQGIPGIWHEICLDRVDAGQHPKESAMDNRPARNNFYGTIEGTLDKFKLAASFAADGWSVRKCSWTDYELTCGVAELILQGDDPMFLHGVVADVLRNVQGIAEVLRNAGASFSLECYGDDSALLTTVRE
jgi:hypothetical protein